MTTCAKEDLLMFGFSVTDCVTVTNVLLLLSLTLKGLAMLYRLSEQDLLFVLLAFRQ